MTNSMRMIARLATLLAVVATAVQATPVGAEERAPAAHYDRGGYYPAPGRVYDGPPNGATAIPNRTGPYY